MKNMMQPGVQGNTVREQAQDNAGYNNMEDIPTYKPSSEAASRQGNQEPEPESRRHHHRSLRRKHSRSNSYRKGEINEELVNEQQKQQSQRQLGGKRHNRSRTYSEDASVDFIGSGQRHTSQRQHVRQNSLKDYSRAYSADQQPHLALNNGSNHGRSRRSSRRLKHNRYNSNPEGLYADPSAASHADFPMHRNLDRRKRSGYGSVDLGSSNHSQENPTVHPQSELQNFDAKRELQFYASHYSPSALRRSFSESESNGSLSRRNSKDSIEDEQLFLLGEKGHRRKLSRRKMSQLVEQQVAIENSKGEVQSDSFRDLLFSIVFIIQLVFVITLGLKYGPSAMLLNPNRDATYTLLVNYRYVLKFAVYCGFFSAGLSALALAIMTMYSSNTIQTSLAMAIALSFLWGTIGVGFSPQSLVPLTGILAMILCIGYTFAVWNRIPFAAANLATALFGLRKNLGLVLVAYGMMFLALFGSIIYTFAFIGVYDKFMRCEETSAVDEECKKVSKYWLIGLVVSFYWMFTTLQYIVQVTVANTISTWWFDPLNASSFCAQATSKGFVKTITYRFGSVCFGALFVGPVGLFRQLVEPFRPQEHESVLLCLQECLLCFQELLVTCVDSIALYINQWALTYVGIYGYGFLKAGKGASLIFEARGWSKIVVDDLLNNVIFIVSIVISGCTGGFGFILETVVEEGEFTSFNKPAETSFLIGVIIGYVLSSVLLAIVSSALSTIIVCFATGPAEFQKNHPDLSLTLRDVWKETWPDSMV